MNLSVISPTWLLCVTLVLSACHVLPPGSGATENELLPPPRVDEAPARDWLVERTALCRQSVPEQRARMMELTVAGKTADERMERLLLASCQPEHTPGLLREALAQFDSLPAGESEQALVILLRDHARSYRILEEKNTQLATQLEATINGIRDIETEVDALRPIRVTP